LIIERKIAALSERRCDVMLYTTGDLLEHCVQRGFGPRVAIVDGERRVTYDELLPQALECAALLKAAGLQRGDRVAIYLPRSIEAVASLFGTFFAGGVAVFINEVLRGKQIEYILEHSEASVIITRARQLRSLPDGAVATRKVVNLDEITPLRATCPPVATIGKDLALLIYTSGSTGLPKGVMVRHENLVAGAEIVADYLKLSADDVLISLLPFSFDYGLNQALGAVLVGATLVIQRAVIPPEICRTLQREKVTVMALLPMLWLQLIDQRSPFLRNEFPHLRCITNTGGRVPVPVVRAVRDAHPHVSIYLMYGLTEAFRSTYLPPEQVDARPDSMGKAIPNCEILIVGEHGPCGVNEVGELVHRGATVTDGYWRDPVSTAKVFRQHPFKDPRREGSETVVFSGDLIRMDAEGYLYFMGRRDQAFKSRGFRVSPEEIEQWVFESDLVGGVVALRRIRDDAENEIVLAVVPKDPPTFRCEDLHGFCKREMPAYLRPQEIWVLKQIPVTSSGKPDRIALQKAYDEQCATP
jgi:amino acid adenylation domain-containing protein